MERDIGATIMLVSISSIVVATLVLWQFEKARHWRAIRAGFRNTIGLDSIGDNELDDDPYDVGMNDKDIL
jgi:hypothetical protein